MTARHSLERAPRRLPGLAIASGVFVLVAAAVAATTGQGVQAERPAAAPHEAAPLVFGTYDRPFAADSLWNSRPVEPRLGTEVIPTSDYFPAVADGVWSTGVFLAKASDPAVVVSGPSGKPGVWDPDAGQLHDIHIPHWPAEVAPAAESDGHAEIVDPVLGVIHSFWQLRRKDCQWTAVLYAWTPLAGRGWGDPAHFYQGARAAAVPSSAGLIRKHEVDDGDTQYRHALAVSLTYNALASDPAYVAPATSADEDAATTNTGRIPEGALLMLPASFDTSTIATPSLRKIAETLKTYGAYVVDRNLGTPYSIYVEIGSDFKLHRHGWNIAAAGDLDAMRRALRPVVSSQGFIDGNGRAFTPSTNLNLLSMRGPWHSDSGAATGRFDSWKQAFVFDGATAQPTVFVNDSGHAIQTITWAKATAGRSYRLEAMTTGGAKLRVQLRARDGSRVLYDSRPLADGETRTFEWPGDCVVVTYAISGAGGPSSVRGDLVAANG